MFKNLFGKKLVTRFPPSPTGLLHIGNVRTALYNYLFTRKNKGIFRFRIEDTDRARSKNIYEEDIKDCLKWLGLAYDGKVLRQSERTKIYKAKIQELIKKGSAYISHETEGENREVVRFRNPGGQIKFQDLIRGEVTMDVSDLKDFIIARNINEPIYHLTVVVDDMESGVTHVIRGEDHISNTPRQILLLEALGGKRPLYAHVPLVLAQDKSKLSKRKHGETVSLRYYIEKGYLPQAMINFLVLIGWNPGGEQEIFTLDKLVEKFDLGKVQSGGGVFNVEKLNWINKEHMKLLPQKERDKNIIENLSYRARKHPSISKILPIIFERIHKWSDVPEVEKDLSYLFEDVKYDDPESFVWKELKNNPNRYEKINQYLKETITLLKKVETWNAESVKVALEEYTKKEGKGNVLWPMRFALSAKAKSLDHFSIVDILDKSKTLERLSRAIDSSHTISEELISSQAPNTKDSTNEAPKTEIV